MCILYLWFIIILHYFLRFHTFDANELETCQKHTLPFPFTIHETTHFSVLPCSFIAHNNSKKIQRNSHKQRVLIYRCKIKTRFRFRSFQKKKKKNEGIEPEARCYNSKYFRNSQDRSTSRLPETGPLALSPVSTP